MIIEIGLFTYILTKSCIGAGAVGYPIDDNNIKQSRTIIVCTDYGPEQTEEIFVHEVTHACSHNHEHHFKTQAELDKHLQTLPEQSEELFVGSLAACMVPVLENVDAYQFLGIIEAYHNGGGSRSMFDPARQTIIANQPRHNYKRNNKRKTTFVEVSYKAKEHSIRNSR